MYLLLIFYFPLSTFYLPLKKEPNMIKIISVFGTRPEAIKMAPVVKKLETCPYIDAKVCVTAQHREMLDQVLQLFSIKPDYDLDIMKSGQTLSDITCRVLKGIEEMLQVEKPDMILVHGDTTTTFSASLAAFYSGSAIGHVEAGLRSGNKASPYPEEMNRSLTGRLADLHFSPTEGNRKNLLEEGIDESIIRVTGNTVIDALLSVVDEEYIFEQEVLNSIGRDRKLVLMTSHRRENLGGPMENIFRAARRIADDDESVELVFPLHLNPKVRKIAIPILAGHERIHLIEPLDYQPFANLIGRACLVLTDSGGIQEEAPALGKPVLVLRTETERPEAVSAGTVKMAGVEEEAIYKMAMELLQDQEAYKKMSRAVNPYGDGKASGRILEAILARFKN